MRVNKLVNYPINSINLRDRDLVVCSTPTNAMIRYILVPLFTSIRINWYVGFKDSMKLRDDKDVKSWFSLFYNFIGISNKICICYNMKV